MRLDLTSSTTLSNLDSNIIEDAVSNDNPIDICRNCYEIGEFDDDVEHPPYDDDIYRCAICGATLDTYVDG